MLTRRHFVQMCSFLGVSLPFLNQKQFTISQEKWKKPSEITLARVCLTSNDSYLPYDKCSEEERKYDKWCDYYNVYEDGVQTARLRLIFDGYKNSLSDCSFFSFILEQQIHLVSWSKKPISTDPIELAFIGTELVRKRSKDVLEKIMSYYGLSEPKVFPEPPDMG